MNKFNEVQRLRKVCEEVVGDGIVLASFQEIVQSMSCSAGIISPIVDGRKI